MSQPPTFLHKHGAVRGCPVHRRSAACAPVGAAARTCLPPLSERTESDHQTGGPERHLPRHAKNICATIRPAVRSARQRVTYGGYGDAGGYPPFVPTVPDEPVAEGRLNLYVTPSSAQVLVDGFYVGTVADFQDRSLWLESGPRRIELRADGYEPATFDVQVIEDRIVDYRRDLVRDARVAAPAEAPRPPAIPKTFYVIPGCYAGDTPPAADRLPSGCSTQNLKTVPPVVSRSRRRRVHRMGPARIRVALTALPRLRHDPHIRKRRLPSLRVRLLRVVVGHRRQDDHVLALLPVDRCRHLPGRGQPA